MADQEKKTEEKNQGGMISYQTYNCYEEMMRCLRPLWNGEQYEEKAQVKKHMMQNDATEK